MATDSRKRLQAVLDALRRLSSGSKMRRRDIFQGPKDGWHSRLIDRLLEEELIIRHAGGLPNDIQYEAVDGGFFAELVKDEIRVARWYFKRGEIPIPTEEEPATAEPTVEVHEFDTDASPEPEAEKEPDPADPRNILVEILKSVGLFGEVLVQLRQSVAELHAKVDALAAPPAPVVAAIEPPACYRSEPPVKGGEDGRRLQDTRGPVQVPVRRNEPTRDGHTRAPDLATRKPDPRTNSWGTSIKERMAVKHPGDDPLRNRR